MPKALCNLRLPICVLGLMALSSLPSHAGSERFSTLPQDPLARINAIRQQAGMPSLKANNALSAAAKNHAQYLIFNPTEGHDQTPGNTGFTGQSVGDRAIHAGYASRAVAENISQGTDNHAHSIDELMTAIYHRFAFLDFSSDEVGLGSEQQGPNRAFVYVMGNTAQNSLCQRPETFRSGRYYHQICADSALKIAEDDWLAAKRKVARQADDLVVWPAPNSRDVIPAFYEETPDPLPDFGVSGQPISVQINPNSELANQDVVIESLRLFKDDTPVEPLRMLTHETDPNGKFTPTEFAWFPLSRLDWNTRYTAELQYEVNGDVVVKTWDFQTRALPSPPLTIRGDQSLNVLSGQTYYLVFAPIKGQPTQDFRTEYDSRINLSLEAVDHDTLEVTLAGPLGARATIRAGPYSVELTLN